MRLLEAEEAKFFQKDGKVKQKVNVADNGIRLSALRTAFELHRSYPPRDPKEAATFGVKVVVMDMPRPNRYIEDMVSSGHKQRATATPSSEITVAVFRPLAGGDTKSVC
jgi:hypothetical protein